GRGGAGAPRAPRAPWPARAPRIRSGRGRGGRIAPGTVGEVLPPPGLPVPFAVEAVGEARRRWTRRVG
ncbi:SRPBCC family protein, partial [Streptomyces sp. DH37]|nr:SRPBCC family protein [Streptomyces sp. DH37]